MHEDFLGAHGIVKDGSFAKKGPRTLVLTFIRIEVFLTSFRTCLSPKRIPLSIIIILLLHILGVFTLVFHMYTDLFFLF